MEELHLGIIAFVAFLGLIAIWLVFYFIPVGLWFSALVSGVKISLLQLILMRWRKVPPSVIVSSMIEGTKAGLHLDPNELEAHYLAGGNVTNVVHALVSAQKANINLDFKMATAIDLAGRDVFEAVQMSVNPKVINTPPVAAVAKDGIQLIAKARVTVRANIKQLVGGAGEETVLARVGEGIVSSIGSAVSHKVVLENPDSISRVVLEKGLDAGTAFEILSIDIADIDVGKNIGAQLQMDQADADKNIAQAKAEERRAMAVALEQENRAKAQDARAKVILAEAEVPLAMAEAFRNGNLGIMDYYKMKNIMADTQMRDTIARNDKKLVDGDAANRTERPTFSRVGRLRHTSIHLFGNRLALGHAIYLVAPPYRRMSAVAIGFVARLTTTAQHHSVADLESVSVHALQSYAAAHPYTAARAYGYILDKSQTRFVGRFERLARLVVPRRKPRARAHRGLAYGEPPRFGILRICDQIPRPTLGVAETREDAITFVVRHSERASFGNLHVAKQRSVGCRQTRIPLELGMRAVAIGFAMRSAATAQRRRFVFGREVTPLLKVPARAAVVGHDELHRERRTPEHQIRTAVGNDYAVSFGGGFRPRHNFCTAHIINVFSKRLHCRQ